MTHVLRGSVTDKGFGVAAGNLAHVTPLILERTGLPGMVPGTLNVCLDEAYFVRAPDAVITAAEYNGAECIMLKRCVLRGLRCFVMRPNTHELGYAHGPAHLELLSAHHLRNELSLSEGARVEVELDGDPQWWVNAK